VAGAVPDPEELKQQVRLRGRAAEDVASLYSFPLTGLVED